MKRIIFNHGRTSADRDQSTPWRKSRPFIVLELTIAIVSLIGAGGLWGLACRYGYMRYESEVM